MGYSKLLIALFWCFILDNTFGQDQTDLCPRSHSIEEPPPDCEWILENSSSGNLRCPIPVLMCHGQKLAPAKDESVEAAKNSSQEEETSLNKASAQATIPNPPHCGPGCQDGFICMRDRSRAGFVHAGFDQSKCVKVAAKGEGLCPMPFVHPASGTCSPNCALDDDCSKGQICCDIGCGLRCSRIIPACENLAIPQPVAPNCYIEETQGPLGHACRNFSLYCVENENRTIVKPMAKMQESPSPSASVNTSNKNDSTCSSNVDCPHEHICVQVGGPPTTHCIRMNNTSASFCPTSKPAANARLCAAINCTQDDDCIGGKKCCDCGCGSLKCIQGVKVCSDQFEHIQTTEDDCYYAATRTERQYRRRRCLTMEKICDRNDTNRSPGSNFDKPLNQTQRIISIFCDETTCPDHLTCIERVKSSNVSGVNFRRAVCTKTNANKTKLCPAPDLEDANKESCATDCATDDDCAAGEHCCDLGCGFRCSRMKPVCSGRALRVETNSRACFHEEIVSEDDEPCRKIRLVCKRPPWRLPKPALVFPPQQQQQNEFDPVTSANASWEISTESSTSAAPSPTAPDGGCVENGCSKSQTQPSVCIDDKISGQIQCVKVDAVGAGVCPMVIESKELCSSGVDSNQNDCSNDQHCSTGQLCCPATCGSTKCLTPLPACDAKPIRIMSPNCYFEKLPNDGAVACHNLRPICFDEFDPTGARSGYITSYNGPAPLGSEETFSGLRSLFRRP